MPRFVYLYVTGEAIEVFATLEKAKTYIDNDGKWERAICPTEDNVVGWKRNNTEGILKRRLR